MAVKILMDQKYPPFVKSANGLEGLGALAFKQVM